MEQPECIVAMGGHDIVMTKADAERLQGLVDHPGYPVMLKLLHGIDQGTRNALGSVETPLDNIRQLQGRLSVVADVRGWLEVEIPTWLQSLSEEETKNG